MSSLGCAWGGGVGVGTHTERLDPCIPMSAAEMHLDEMHKMMQ